MSAICPNPEDHRSYPTGHIRQGRCVRCGHLMPDPKPQPEPARDPVFEARFMEDVLDMARRFVVGNDAYPAQVRQRLAVGAERYGDEAFLERDNLNELREETPDLGGFATLELQKLRRQYGEDSDEYQQDRLNLLAIAAFGAAADHHAQQIIRRRAGAD